MKPIFQKLNNKNLLEWKIDLIKFSFNFASLWTTLKGELGTK